MRIVVLTILFLVMVKGTFAQKEGRQLVDSLTAMLPGNDLLFYTGMMV